ncbi:hypothetical protein Scep_006557 [Stephania cephalantha]|uniref:Uncharacterized protein n=1 Tax=Stephania cephalantha TaxID=152367 RepID=A0AAP0K9F0_9MAGN
MNGCHLSNMFDRGGFEKLPKDLVPETYACGFKQSSIRGAIGPTVRTVKKRKEEPSKGGIRDTMWKGMASAGTDCFIEDHEHISAKMSDSVQIPAN